MQMRRIPRNPRRSMALLATLVAALAIASCSGGKGGNARTSDSGTRHASSDSASSSDAARGSSSDSASTGSGSSGGASTDTPSPLGAKLLTTTELGAGWKTDNSSDSGSSDTSDTSSTDPACLKNVQNDLPGQQDESDGSYAKGAGGPPTLDQSVMLIGGGKSAAALKSIKDAFGGCHDFSFSDGGTPVHATLLPMAIAPVGDESAAWEAKFTEQDLTGAIEFLAFRKGDIVEVLVYSALDPVDQQVVQQFAAKAAAKA